jgi:hypothetical protein
MPAIEPQNTNLEASKNETCLLPNLSALDLYQEGIGKSIFASRSKPEKNVFDDQISAKGVEQGKVGDCFFESALASVANSSKGQQQIKEMIKENEDGSYTVTFPGDKAHPVNVTQKDLDDNRMNGNVQDNADWARVIETAFLKYDHAAAYKSGLLDNWQHQQIPYLAKLMSTRKALELLTGDRSATACLSIGTVDNRELYLGKTSKANLARDLENAFKNGDAVTCQLLFPSDGLVSHHVYSVLGYDPKTQEIIVRNPWGENNGTPFAETGSSKDGISSLGDGELKMSLDKFMRTFDDLNMSGKSCFDENWNNLKYDAKAQAADLGRIGASLLSGNFRQLDDAAINYLRDNVQTTQDLTATGLNPVLEGTSISLNALTSTAKKLEAPLADLLTNKAPELIKTLTNIKRNVANNLNPFKW